jgi:uncharacterized protein (TIRG00374 family)
VGGLLAIGLLALFLRGVDWPHLRDALLAARPIPLLGLVLVTVLAYALRAWRWGFLLRPLGSVPFTRLFAVTILGFLAGFVIPRAGEVLRPFLVSRSHGIATSAGFATIVLERLFDLLTVLGLFAAYLFVLSPPAQQIQGPQMGVLKAAGAFTAAGAAAILVLLVAFQRNATAATAFLERMTRLLPARLRGPVLGVVHAFGDGLGVFQAPPTHLLVVLGQSVLLWLAYALGFHFNNLAFGIDLPFRANFLLLAFLTVGVSIPTPGTVGGFHAFFLLCMTEMFGVGKDTAVAAGIAAHALSNLPVLLLGLVFLGREGLTLGKVAEMTEVGDAGAAGSGR